MAQTLPRVPDDGPTPRREPDPVLAPPTDAHDVSCPTCKAPVGVGCELPGTIVHLARAAKAISAGCRARHPAAQFRRR